VATRPQPAGPEKSQPAEAVGGWRGRLRDRLPLNLPYEGIVAEAYDTWVPVDEAWPDEPVYRALLADVEGPVLELGCGTGRPLLRWLAEGVPVEGLDSSGDMLTVLRRHAAERQLAPTVHLGEMAPLALGRTYGAIVCLAGTFSLVLRDRVPAALASYRDHLRPGGLVALSLFAGPPPPVEGGGTDTDPHAALRWRLRRTGTVPSGETFVVSEAVLDDPVDDLQVTYNRVERVAADGRVVETHIRRFHLQRWTRPAFEELLAAAGFADVHSIGDDAGWVAVGRAG
jgi:SAM-dependent methyltransferase